MTYPPVMAGLVLAMHVFVGRGEDVHSQHEAGHDDGGRVGVKECP